MKKLILKSIVVFSVLFNVSHTFSDEIIWVPISLGDITFFVPLGDSMPVTPPPILVPIVDTNLRQCIDEAKIANGWINDDEVITIHCVGKGIASLSGIGGLINLEQLYVGQNYISDLSPVSNLSKLKRLSTASYSFSNSIDDADLASISNLNQLEWLQIGNNPPIINLDGSGFLNGFTGLNQVEIENLNSYECSLSCVLDRRGITDSYAVPGCKNPVIGIPNTPNECL